MGHILVTPPVEEPLTLAEAKAWLREDGADSDDMIESLIVSARMHCEGVTRRSFVTQIWRADLPGFPCGGGEIRLPHGPVQSISALRYYDDANVDTLLDPSLYQADLTQQLARIWPAVDETWPGYQARADAVRISYVAGYGGAAAVPAPLKTAMLRLIAHWYDNRGVVGETGELPLGVRALLAPYIIRSLA